MFAFPGLDDLRERLAGADPRADRSRRALEVGSCLAFVAAFRGVFSHRLSWRFSYEVGMAEQAANVLLPTGGAGGLALGAWALRRIGMPAERIGRRTVAFFLITSSVNFAAVIFAGIGLGARRSCRARSPSSPRRPGAARRRFLTAIALSPRVIEGGEAEGAGRIRSALAKGRGYLADGVRDAVALLGTGRPLIVSARSATWRST